MELEVSFTVNVHTKLYRHFVKHFHGSFQTNDPPTIPFLDIYPRELKSYVHTKSCIQMVIPTKPRRHPSKGNKLWYILKMKFHSAIKGNEVLIHVATLLSERSLEILYQFV